MVGIVIVSHSHRLAQGVKELAEQVAGGKVTIATAGGLDDATLGTSAERVQRAISEAYGDDGVVVLVDLGSAVMTAEVALVEGAVGAAVQAAAGAPLSEVDRAARRAVELMKPPTGAADSDRAGLPAGPPQPTVQERDKGARAVLTVRNSHGLHARPAAEFVRTSARFKSAISVRNLNRSGRVANGKSIVEVLSLGVECGHTIEVSADGPDQDAAIEALRTLVESGAGE